jgi:hypothetical protein
MKPGKIIVTDRSAWLYLVAIEWVFIKGPFLLFVVLLACSALKACGGVGER